MQGTSLKIVSNVLYIIFYTFIILFNCPSGSPQPCSSPTTATAMPPQQSRTRLPISDTDSQTSVRICVLTHTTGQNFGHTISFNGVSFFL